MPADDCCYRYHTVPGNLTCNPHGRPRFVLFHCLVYAPSTAVGVRMRWYRSNSVGLGDNLFEVNNYLPPSGHVEEYIVLSATAWIENFTSIDNGYYWCQIEVNNTCLLPSPPALITFTSRSDVTCSSVNALMIQLSPLTICADSSSPFDRPLIFPPNTLLHTTNSTTTTITEVHNSTTAPSSDQDFTALVFGLLVFIIVVLSGALTLSVAVGLFQRHIIKVKTKGRLP